MQDDSVHTVNAAAVVLAAAARSSTGLRHHQQLDDDDHASVTKKRWWSRLKAKLCFRPHGHPRRIADDADPSPQPSAATGHTSAYVHQAPQPVLAFVAPPSSPASSLLASDSGARSPVLLNASTYSSPTTGPPSIFAVGPYAHGPQQLVSPPVPSEFTTEPSTAPLTPPPESAHLHLATNPSSPEVPFARFLTSSAAPEQHCGGEALFHAYHLHPGSPIGGAPIVSPGSGCSTSSSPRLFLVAEQHPRILGPEEIASRKLHRLRARNEGSLLDGHIPVASGAQEQAIRRAVSFDASTGTGSEEGGGSARVCVDDDELPKSVEFVFGNADGGAVPVDAMDGDARKKWPFFRHG